MKKIGALLILLASFVGASYAAEVSPIKGSTGTFVRVDISSRTDSSNPAGKAKYFFETNAGDLFIKYSNGITTATVASMNTSSFTVNELLRQTNRPAFVSAAPSWQNITGDGTVVTIPYTTEVYDNGNNFSGSTFTVPSGAGGIYLFCASVELNPTAAGNTNGQMVLRTTNRNYAHYIDDILTTYFDFNLCTMTDMNAGDIAYVTVEVAGATKILDIISGTGSKFSGALIHPF